MRAMILAAGYGTRLWPLTIDRAKPAIPFMGRPIVGYIAEYLAGYGYTDVVVNLHHRPDSVRGALGDGSRFGVRLHYSEEHEILGTSGAIDNARPLLGDEPFLVINGKIITDIDLAAALETHRREQALATLVLRPNRARERYSIVRVEKGLTTGFGPMPTLDVTASDNDPEAAPLMFTGIQILEPRIFSYIPRGCFSHSTTDVYPQAIARGERIVAHIASGEWHEVSTIERYLGTNIHFLHQRGLDKIAGDGSIIDPGASVSGAVLWEDVRVEAGAIVEKAVLGRGVHVGRGDVIRDAAVVPISLVEGTEAPPKSLPGRREGLNFIVPLHSGKIAVK